MLKVITALFLVAIAYGAYVEVDNSGHNFRISLNGASEVRWTKDGNNYRHLQELARYCPVPGTPVALGGIGNWQCGPLDTLLNLNCSLTPGSLFFPVVKEINGAFECAPEEDTLAYLLPTCTAGQTIKYEGGKWVCAADFDTFKSLSLTCPSGSTILYNGGAFVCASASGLSDSDLLATITCSNGQLVRFFTSTGTFGCDNDFNTIPSPCTAGQLVVYTGTWTCKDDSDVLSAGIPTCNNLTPYLKYRNGQWICTDQFFVLNYIGQPGFLTYIQTANILDASSSPQAFTSYTVLWGSINQASEFSTNAPIFPFNGTVTSTYIVLQNFQSNSGATVAVDFTVDGTPIATPITITVAANPNTPQTITFLSPVFSGQSFTAGQAVSIAFRTTSGDLSSTPPLLSSVFTAVYISVSI